MIDEIGGDFLQWLRGFYFVAKKESVTRAGLEMGRNQSTISYQIKCLENEFGVTLFDRSSGKMELTPEGHLFLDKTVSLFEIVKEMKSDTGENYLPQKGKIRVVATHAIIHYFLPPYIVDFRAAFPSVNFEVEGGGLQMILEKVESAEADFGIASLEIPPDHLVYLDVFETELKLLAPKNSFFSKGRSPSIKQISEAPFIFFPRSSTITPLIERKFQDNSLELNSVLVLNNFESVKKYVALGVGISILDDYLLTREDGAILDIFSLDNLFKKRKYGLILREKKYLSPVVRAFLHSIKHDIQF